MNVAQTKPALRSFEEFSSEFLMSALPTTAEIRSFSDVELQQLKNLSNILDNLRYMEKKRRYEAKS